MKETAAPTPAVADRKIWRGALERQLRYALRTPAVVLFLCGAALRAESEPLTTTEELQGIQLAKFALATEIAATPDGPNAEQTRKLARLADAYLGLVERHPESSEARLAAGSFLWSLQRFDEAKNQWDIAAKLDPESPEVAYSFGVWHLANGDTVSAAEAFGRAVALQPGNALYHHSLGNTLFLFRHQNAGTDGSDAMMERALSHLRKAAELAPLSVKFARGYAETFYGMPDPDWNAALAAWKHFLEITDDKDLAYTHLARAALKLGDKDQANAYLERITDPQYERLKAKLMGKLNGE